MKNTKKVLAMLLSVLLLIGVFSGCGATAGEKAVEGTAAAAEGTPKAEASATATPQQAEATPEPVTVKWYIRNAEPKNFGQVMGKINETLKEKQNVTLEMVCVEPAQWKDKMPLMLSAGEKFDLTWAGSWGGFPFSTAVEKGAYVDITDMVAENLVESVKIIPQPIWDGIKVKGRLYSMPNYQITYSQEGIMAKKELLDKYKIDPESLKTLDGLGVALQTIKDGEPDIYPLLNGQVLGLYQVDGQREKGIYSFSNSGIEVFLDTHTMKAIPDDFAQQKIARDFNVKGFFSPDAMTVKDATAEFKTGKYFCNYTRYKPGASAELTAANGFDIVAVPITKPILGNSLATMTAVSSTSEHPERALRMWDLFNQDAALYNTLIYGLEGQDYKKTGDNRIELIPDAYLMPGWMMANQFNAYLLPGQPDDVWAETMRMNVEAQLNPLNGFSMDTSMIKSEVANLMAVMDEFRPIWLTGIMDSGEFALKYEEKRKQAGYETFVSELEKQLAAWATAEGK